MTRPPLPGVRPVRPIIASRHTSPHGGDVPPAPIEPLSTRMLAQSAYEVLRRMILSGALPPGSRIRVDALAARWDVSRTPVREAVARLALVDLVAVARNSRTSVAHWTPLDVLERVELIAALTSSTAKRWEERAASSPSVPVTPVRTATSTAPDVHEFVRLCTAVLGSAGGRVGLSTVRRHLAPIVEDFYVESTAERFGVQLAVGADERRTLVADLGQAIAAGDGACTDATIAAYVRALGRAHPHGTAARPPV